MRSNDRIQLPCLPIEVFARAGIVLLLGAALVSSGCATPLAERFGKLGADRAVEEAAADESFPSAAQVGLASTNVSPKQR